MQKAKQKHFRERMIFYTSKLIANQEGIKGTNFGYDIKPVHVVSFINFDFGKKNGASPELDRPILRYKTTETELGNEMPGSSRYFFLNIPRFKKNLENLNDNEEIWLYLLRDSKFLDKIPEQLLGNKAFETYFEASRRVGFTEQENQKYIEDMMNEWDIENAMNEAVAEAREDGMQKGMEKGRQDERLEIARKMLADGMSVDVVSKYSALPPDEIESLQ